MSNIIKVGGDMEVNLVTVGDWELILAICHWSYKPKLPKELVEKAYKEAWKYTDAYGHPGYIPPQGYDWSGFRDSSELANTRSANAIRVVLAQAGITEFEADHA
jgi:hypothetical protein